MEHIADKVETNMEKTTDERNKINQIQKQAISSFCQRIIMLLISTGVFIAMIMFIWLFPNKIKTIQ